MTYPAPCTPNTDRPLGSALARKAASHSRAVGVLQAMLGPAFYAQSEWWLMAGVLLFLCLAKIAGTCLTLKTPNGTGTLEAGPAPA